MPKAKRPRASKRSAPYKKGANVQSLMDITERTLALSDNTVMTPQDAYETKQFSNLPPTTIPRAFAKQGYWYKGTYSANPIASSVTVPVGANYAFALSNCYLSSALTSVFDQYCIVRAVIRFLPVNTVTNSSAAPGDFTSVIDHDDITGLSSKAQAQGYTTSLTTLGTQGQTRVIQPRFAAAAYSGSVFTAFANTRGYIDAASSSVPHYGCKVVLDPSVGVVYIYNVEIELFIHFRDVRS